MPNLPNASPALVELNKAMNGPLSALHVSGWDMGWVPPELHLFGVNSDDSVSGVVVPAPEVSSPTWPGADYHPVRGSERSYVTLRTAAVAWTERNHAQNPTETEALNTALRALPDLGVAVPVDYRVLDGGDGLPMWVPSWSWRESDVGTLVRPHDIPERMAELTQAGRPGSALHMGRHIEHQLRKYPDQHVLSEAIWRGLAGAYAALQRPEYAALAASRGGAEVAETPAAGTVPLSALGSLASRLKADLPGFAGITGGSVTIGRALRTRGNHELVLHVHAALDPSQRADGADIATVLLAQAFASDITYGPVAAEVVMVGQRIPEGTPRPADSDLDGLMIFERGYLLIHSRQALDEREGDLAPFAEYR